MIIGVCVILIIAFVMTIAFVARRYDESMSRFLESLFVLIVFALGMFFLLIFAFDALSHDIR